MSSDDKLWSWQYNVQDHLKNRTTEEIKEYLHHTSLPFAVCMSQIVGDFNFGAVIRSANAFNAREVFYYGKKKYDRRSTVGTHNYFPVNYLSEIEQLKELAQTYTLVALENNTQYPTQDLRTFVWPSRPLIMIGEEGCGLTPEILNMCQVYVEIPMMGSVRSFNATNAASIAMYDYVSKRND